MATIVEVAKRAQVSIATVSNVIRGTRKVSEELTARVEEAIRELSYSPNEIARSLKVKQTRMLVFILPDITNPFFPEIVRGAEDAAFERGYFLLTANTNEQRSRERRVVSALRSYRVGGILLASAEGLHHQEETQIPELTRHGVSVVCLDRTIPGVPTDAVLLDNVGGAYQCTRHLIEQGHRRIAIITGTLELQTGLERLEGYRKAIEDAQLPIQSTLIAEGDFRFDSGRKLMHKLMHMRTRPSAVMVSNGLMCMGAMRAMQELELSWPGDIALATFDDVGEHVTAVVQPSYEMGSRAASILMDRIEGVLTPQTHVLRIAPQLVLRASTASPVAVKSHPAKLRQKRS
jgi:LacI family transcriptional regulator